MDYIINKTDNNDHLNNVNQVTDYLNFESDDDGEEIMDSNIYIPDEPDEDTVKRD